MPRAQPTKSATRALANSIANTAASSANRQCAISKLFVLLVLSRRDLMAGATRLEPATSAVTASCGSQTRIVATSTYSHRSRRFLSHLDDDLALRTSIFDVGHGLFDRFEWKNSIHDWAYDSRIDERCDRA